MEKQIIFLDREKYFKLLSRLNNEVYNGKMNDDIYYYAVDAINNDDIKTKFPKYHLPYGDVTEKTYERLLDIPVSEHLKSIEKIKCECFICRIKNFIWRIIHGIRA